MATPPVFWNLRRTVQDNVSRVTNWMAHYAGRLPEGAAIDEASVLAPRYRETLQLAAQLQRDGWYRFNAAEDLVFTNPFGTRYRVAYEFFRHPNLSWRLEVMSLGQDANGQRGFSPLHEALLSRAGVSEWPMPHLSFKVPVDETLDKHLEGEPLVSLRRRAYCRAVDHLKAKACIHAMTCQSTYGVFGYFLGNETQAQIYLKPRANLRDLV